MKQGLNIQNVNRAMGQKGLSQADVAQRLGVTGAEVSAWLAGNHLPRPRILLDLDRLLGLGFDALVTIEDPDAPRVAFRKARGTKTKDHHIEKAAGMGRLLRELAPFSPFAAVKEAPPELKSPRCDYEYLQQAAARVRAEVGLGASAAIDLEHLLLQFRKLQAVIVPVLWGEKQRYENALHIYLPDSKSTWVYLNLDTHVHDFMFWMAHELGHCLSPSLEGKAAEDFADAFAGTLLYPHALAQTTYERIAAIPSQQGRIRLIIDLADEHTISPNSVFIQTDRYAHHTKQPLFDLGKTFFPQVTNFHKDYNRLSQALFSDFPNASAPSARDYIAIVEKTFETPFFDMLRKLLQQRAVGPGFIQSVLDIPHLDARSIHDELC